MQHIFHPKNMYRRGSLFDLHNRFFSAGVSKSLQLKYTDYQRLPGRTKIFLRSMTTWRRKGNSSNPCMAALPGSIPCSSLTGSFGSFHAWMHARAPRSNMQPQYFYLFGKSRKHRSRKKSTIREMLTSTDRTLLCPIACTPALQDLRYFFPFKENRTNHRKKNNNQILMPSMCIPIHNHASGQLSQITNEELRLCFTSTKNRKRVPHFFCSSNLLNRIK